jgi:hypothetical protein
MSMGGGGGGMPMASNQGQQMQNPQMGQQGMMGQMPPQGGMFGQGGTTMMTNPNMGGQIAPMQVGQQVGGGMGSVPSFANQKAYDDFMARGGMQGMQGMQDRMAGIGALGGMNYTGGSKNFDETGGGLLGGGPGRSYPINDGPMMPPGAGYPQPTNTTMPLPRRRPDDVLVSKPPGDLPGRGMPPGYGPTKGPIDGRKLRDMIDIRTRRPVDGLPNALENNLPPSLKRPTQNRRG